MTTPLASRPADAGILAEIAAGLAAGGDMREVLERFLEPIMCMAGAQAGAVRVLSPAGDRFELVASVGLPADVQEAERDVQGACGFCGTAAGEVRMAWAADLGTCAARSHGAYFGQACRCALAVPLLHKGRVLGVYNLFFASDAQPDAAVCALLRSVGELLGLALDHLRLEAENLRATVAQERQRMAADVHDAVAQNLTFIKLRLPLLRDAVVDQRQEDALKYLEDVREAAAEAHGSLREIIKQFRTRSGPRGLGRAMEALASRFSVRTGVPLQLNNRMPQLQLPAEDETEVVHIVQEALANVEHHANARHGWLSLEPTLAGVEIRVEDDGVGPAASGEPGHYGVEIMRERAARVGGELSLAARPQGGTVVRLALPIGKKEAA